MFPLLSSKNSPAHFTDRSSWVHARCEFRQNYRPRIRPRINHDKWDSVVCVTLSFVQQTLNCWMLHVVSVCTPCCMLLRRVWMSQQLPTFILFHDRRGVAQQRWIRLHSSSNIGGATHAHYTWSRKSYGLHPSHDALQVLTLLGVVASFAHHCRHGRNYSQHCWPNIVWSCCIRLHTTAKRDAITPNTVRPTMLGVVASVCTPCGMLSRKVWNLSNFLANNSQHFFCSVIFGPTKLGVVAPVCM